MSLTGLVFSIYKTVKPCQIHRSNHKWQTEFGEKLTVERQIIVDLCDLPVIHREDVQCGSAIYPLVIFMVDREGGRSVDLRRHQPHAPHPRTFEQVTIEERFHIDAPTEPGRDGRESQGGVFG